MSVFVASIVVAVILWNLIKPTIPCNCNHDKRQDCIESGNKCACLSGGKR